MMAAECTRRRPFAAQLTVHQRDNVAGGREATNIRLGLQCPGKLPPLESTGQADAMRYTLCLLASERCAS